ncbi:energy-coupling factor transporter transmembrane component T family protein [Youngiibacter fragilis]|uniref:Cobalt permease n=1 Tax=Youngiibacter fragilis 232.1 TaxID=994573 RepID=V7I6U0_9CLOT|nr:energy-coupling factor transporter transmembrane component T [Youngiibacter fragilis]ETA80929.1 cobalt permease [Youngiibacter fragilis 232.1]
MPEWLIKEEDYVPDRDKDGFIGKSILSILGILSRIKSQGRENEGKYIIDANLKVIFTFILALMVSLAKNFTFVVVVNVYLLVVLCLQDAGTIIRVLRISLIMAAFTFVMLIPAITWGSGSNAVMLTGKVFATVTAVNLLSRTTRWNDITGALKVLRVPDIFILVLDITIKYIVLLGEFSLNMLYALKLRSVGKDKGKYQSISGIAGSMFVKSREMAEDMYSAMECRGFTGEYKKSGRIRLGLADYAYMLANIGLVLTFIYLGRV